jgi:hypothetical protein
VHYMSVKIYNSLPICIKMRLITQKIWISLEEIFTWELILFIGRILQFWIRFHLNSLFYWSSFNYFSLTVNVFKQYF